MVSNKKKIDKVPINKKLGIMGARSTATMPITLPSGLVYNPTNISLNTFSKMREDYQISACLNVYNYTIQKLDWYIDGDDKKIKDHIEYSIDKIWSRLIRSTSKAFWSGYSPNVKVFTEDPESGLIIYDKPRDLDPLTCTVRENDNGGFDGFIQYIGQTREQVIPADLAFWYAHQMENGNLYGRSALISAYKPWYFSELLHLWANRYYERFGEPVVIGRAPDEDVEDKNGTPKHAMDLMQTIVESLKSHSAVTIPSDVEEMARGTNLFKYDISYLESQMRGVDFETYLKRLDMEKARAIFVPDLLLGTGNVGSYELGKEHKETFLTGLMGVVDDIMDYINLYLIPPLVDINFGPTKKYPKIKYTPMSKINEDSLVQVVQSMINGGLMTPSPQKLADIMGVPLAEPDELPKEDKITEKQQPDKQQSEKQIVDKTSEKQLNRIREQVELIFGSNVSDREKISHLSKIKIGYLDKFISDCSINSYDKKKAEVLARKMFDTKEKLVRDCLIAGFQKGKDKKEILESIAKI